MQPSSEATPAPPSPRAASGGRKRLCWFLVSMTPVAALLALLFWGQFRPDANPGGLLEHNAPAEAETALRDAPDFTGFDLLTGAPVSIQSMRGRIVVVDFWSSWCAACRAEAQVLADVHRAYADAGAPVEFVGVAIWDAPDDALAHLRRYGAAYPNILDPDGSSAVAYGVRGVPEKFFLDADGRIVRKVIGPVDAGALRDALDDMLAAA